MISDNKSSASVERSTLYPLKENLADFLTLSRVIIGLIILSLGFIGKDAYITVVILALIGGATDIFDGKAARRYLLKKRQSRLGKYDVDIDNFLVLSIIAYISFSGIVSPIHARSLPPSSRSITPTIYGASSSKPVGAAAIFV